MCPGRTDTSDRRVCCLSCLSGSLRPYLRHLVKLLLLSCSALAWMDLNFLDLWLNTMWLEGPVFGDKHDGGGRRGGLGWKLQEHPVFITPCGERPARFLTLCRSKSSLSSAVKRQLSNGIPNDLLEWSCHSCSHFNLVTYVIEQHYCYFSFKEVCNPCFFVSGQQIKIWLKKYATLQRRKLVIY